MPISTELFKRKQIGNPVRKSNMYDKEYYERHKEERKIASRAYYNKNAKRISEQKKVYRLVNKDKIRGIKLEETYGLSNEEYNAILESQDGKCAVCGKPNSGYSDKGGNFRKMFVDHDHETGKVRGLLCRDCNFALGLLKDNPETILRLYEYAKTKILL